MQRRKIGNFTVAREISLYMSDIQRTLQYANLPTIQAEPSAAQSLAELIRKITLRISVTTRMTHIVFRHFGITHVVVHSLLS
jgi:hypothetical protein